MPLIFGSFPEFLASTLRVEDNIRVYHVCTAPTVVKPIFTSLPGIADEHTTCESHFLTISQTRLDKENCNVDALPASREVLILGIEILVFDTPSLKTIFVSKADSTGLVQREFSSKGAASSLIRTVISAFIEWLVDQNLQKTKEPVSSRMTDKPQSSENTENVDTCQGNDTQHASDNSVPLGRKKLVLSLFARSQNQYLFPGSIENTTKHVLDDRQLIKWWCRLLDKIAQKEWNINRDNGNGTTISETSNTSASTVAGVPSLTTAETHTSLDIVPQAYVIVPGCDRADTIRSFFPPSHQSTSGRKWQNAFPIEHFTHQTPTNASIKSIPARCLIPRLPDDPKARFCDDLDAAGTDGKGQWSSVKSIAQFWELMEYRQECAAGRLVGFVWVILAIDETQIPIAHLAEPSSNSSNKISLQQNGYVEGTDVRLPPTTPESVLLTSDQYIELSDLLIKETDFAGVECAANSTLKWLEKVKALSGAPIFGVEVTGKLVASSSVATGHVDLGPSSANGTGSLSNDSSLSINTLVGVRKKKRDAETAGVVEASPASSVNDILAEEKTGANILGSGLVRKKPKIQ